VWAHPEPADLRAGFDGLAALVTSRLGRDPLSGHLFLFVNRNRTRAKVLVWDGTGLCIDLVTVKEILGHRSIATTERYAHLSDAHKRAAMARLDSRTSAVGKGAN
jgi:integrase